MKNVGFLLKRLEFNYKSICEFGLSKREVELIEIVIQCFILKLMFIYDFL